MKYILILYLLSTGGYTAGMPSSVTVPFNTLDACIVSAKVIVNDQEGFAFCTDQMTGLTTGKIEGK